ncbi:MAG: 30S ribosomal protein S2 [Phycisphaerales bacterium]|nr:30S ribosomal protein S2 [Phycisphaerales bacterium]
MSEAKQFVRDLVDSGIHFGHRTSRWNPKMKPYIYGKKNLIHIIDVRETLKGLMAAQKFLSRLVASGRDVLFVGTKRQARSVVEEVGKQTGMPVVIERWLGGTLTNFRTIRSRLQRLEELERILQSPELNKNYSKKMESSLKREYQKILRNLAGIRTMDRLPGAMFVVDVRRENIAILEARKLGIPVVGIIDTDSNPDLIDIAIPGNDDAMRGIDLLMKQIAAAINEGKAGRVAKEEQDKAQQQQQRPSRGRRRTTTAEAEDAAAQIEKPQAAATASPAGDAAAPATNA